MRYQILATDYDGTIAFEGRVDDRTIECLRVARQDGLRLIMVTGRELTDLFNTFEHSGEFDLIVAENGAVVYEPAGRQVHTLAAAPPAPLIERLTAENVPVSVGHSVVATVEPHEQHVLAAIHELSLDWHLIFNKGSVMALPSDVTKATGLARALEMVGAEWTATIGVGDAENDIAFLRRTGLAVAVANALPTVKEIADVVTVGARGAGVMELIGRWQRGDLDLIQASRVENRAGGT
jgi:hydroxymethylpyrimidine pyrophosphatase-like HAD family hydrolase